MTQYTYEQQRRNRTKWMLALRSDDYEQGRGALNRGGQFCCLGVACDIAASEGIVHSTPAPEGFTAYGSRGATGTLPKEVSDWLGTDEVGRVGRSGTSLAYLNDQQNLTLKQISYIVEAQI